MAILAFLTLHGCHARNDVHRLRGVFDEVAVRPSLTSFCASAPAAASLEVVSRSSIRSGFSSRPPNRSEGPPRIRRRIHPRSTARTGALVSAPSTGSLSRCGLNTRWCSIEGRCHAVLHPRVHSAARSRPGHQLQIKKVRYSPRTWLSVVWASATFAFTNRQSRRDSAGGKGKPWLCPPASIAGHSRRWPDRVGRRACVYTARRRLPALFVNSAISRSICGTLSRIEAASSQRMWSAAEVAISVNIVVELGPQFSSPVKEAPDIQPVCDSRAARLAAANFPMAFSESPPHLVLLRAYARWIIAGAISITANTDAF